MLASYLYTFIFDDGRKVIRHVVYDEVDDLLHIEDIPEPDNVLVFNFLQHLYLSECVIRYAIAILRIIDKISVH